MARAKAGPQRSGPTTSPASDTLYGQMLLFPERAEYLAFANYSAYRVQLDHWRELSSVFQRAFRTVYDRQSASVLLVHGEQGTGKTLFTRKLAADFEKSRAGALAADRENLWHVLTGGESLDLPLIQEATKTSNVKLLGSSPGWLAAATATARDDRHKMRVFIVDDFHKDAFLSEWAGLARADYLQIKTNAREALLESVAQRIVEDCRGDFARSLMVLLSADRALIDELKNHLDRSHRGLAEILQLPLPESAAKEQIVRTNINRLNQRSYWYCLDQGGPEEKVEAYRTLKGPGGFIDSFRATDRALLSGSGDNRTGRPANKNLLTFVTLGSPPAEVSVFLADREMVPSDEFAGAHIHTWLFRRSWASALESSDQEYVRAAALVESEFALRWIALDARATWALCDDTSPKALTDLLVSSIRETPSNADRGATKKTAEAAEKSLADLTNVDKIDAFMRKFRNDGQGRSRTYESSLAKHFGKFSHGLAVKKSVKPDIIFDEYSPCAVTNASADDAKAIERVIRRECHIVEFTAHLQADLRGLAEYLRSKVLVYAELLQSV